MLNGQAGYFTITEAATLLHVSRWTIAAFIRRKRVPTRRVGYTLLIRLEDLQGLRVPYVALRP
jgi:excisionase family DNA binding protein